MTITLGTNHIGGTMRQNYGFTVIELLVVISIIALLVSLLIPAIAHTKASASTVDCSSNLRQIAMAQHAYAGDWDGSFTDLYIAGQPKTEWIFRLADYFPSNRFNSVFTCAAFRSRYKLDRNHRQTPTGNTYPAYYLNAIPYFFTSGILHTPVVAYLRQSSIRSSSETILIAEGGLVNCELAIPNSGPYSWASGWKLGTQNAPDLRHRGGNNYAFADGHVGFHHGEAPNLAAPGVSLWRSW